MSILAIDYGRRRIGLALSRANFLATRYKTLLKNKQLLNDFQKIIHKENIDLLVFGIPKGLGGKKGTLEDEAQKFAQNLEKTLNLPIVLIDEGFTSEQALQNLKEEGLPLAKSKLLVDHEAAKIILEEYLNSIRQN